VIFRSKNSFQKPVGQRRVAMFIRIEKLFKLDKIDAKKACNLEVGTYQAGKPLGKT
jgi:hypothetical protein